MFIYFIPEHPRAVATREDFLALGLAHALTDGSPSSARTANGPEGRGGVIAVPQGADAPGAAYDAKAQTWRGGPIDDATGKPRWYVGFVTAKRPTPAGLQTARFVGGEELVLGDGQRWTVPIALSFVTGRGSTLPARFVLAPDGKTWELAELPDFAEVSQAAERVVEAFRQADVSDGKATVTMDVGESLAMCVQALSCNYRLSAVEVDLLGLLTTSNRWEILRALVDDHARARVEALGEKKTTTPDTSAINSGVTAG